MTENELARQLLLVLTPDKSDGPEQREQATNALLNNIEAILPLEQVVLALRLRDGSQFLLTVDEFAKDSQTIILEPTPKQRLIDAEEALAKRLNTEPELGDSVAVNTLDHPDRDDVRVAVYTEGELEGQPIRVYFDAGDELDEQWRPYDWY